MEKYLILSDLIINAIVYLPSLEAISVSLQLVISVDCSNSLFVFWIVDRVSKLSAKIEQQ